MPIVVEALGGKTRTQRTRTRDFFDRLLLPLLFLLPAGSGAALPADPNTTNNTVVRFEIQRGSTNLGRVDVELFDRDKPETVRNFLLYTRSGAFSNGFFHRCVPGFIVQGGGFSVTNPAVASRFNGFMEVTNLGGLTNEFLVGPRLTNTFGTLAMAKIGGDPDSATSQWFFNLGNNATNLDNQNGGFTVFGRVLESTNLDEGTNVLAHFNALSTSAGIVNLGNLIGSTYRVFSDLPVSYTNTVFRVPEYNELYYVKVSVLNDTTPPGPALPTISLLSPTPNQRFTNQTVTVRGTAEDDTGVARVIYRVQGGEAQIAHGTTNWEFHLAPQAGFNTVSVETIDCDGRHSTNNPSVTFFYLAQTRLDLQVVGNGRVTGATNGQLLQSGRYYTLTAKPSSGHVFQNWSGSAAGVGATITFLAPTSGTNFDLTARFAPDPFIQLAGTYHGLFLASASPALDDTGFLAMSLNRRGIFSGSIRHQGGRYSYTGRFDRSGSAFVQGTLGGVSRSLSLQLQLTDAAGVVTGSLLGGDGTTEARLERLASTLPATNPPPLGRYTLALPGSSSTNVPRQLSPGGSGFGGGKLSRNGTLSISGTLGDGRTFSATPRLSRSARWPLYVPLSGGRGVMLGWLAATNGGQLDGTLQWMSSPNLKSARYPGGFTNQIHCLGSFYSPPTGSTRVMNWVHGLSRLSGANLELPMTNLVKLAANNTLTAPPPEHDAPVFSLDLKTGLVKGSFVHPWVGTTNALRGAILQRDSSIRGQFLESDQSGNLVVSVTPFLVTQAVASTTLEGLTAALTEGGLLRFEQDGVITLTETLVPPFDTALDANGHNVVISGGGARRLFEVRSNLTFTALGITFADGRHTGANGASGISPEPGGDGCGGGFLNFGGTLHLTNCVLTNFFVEGGTGGSLPDPSVIAAPGGRAMGAVICNQRGRVTLHGCTVVDNVALGGRGARDPVPNSISGVRGTALGGAIFSDGDCEVEDTAFLRNEARGAEHLPADAISYNAAGPAAGGALALVGGRLRLGSSQCHSNSAIAPGSPPVSTPCPPAHGGALFVETNAEAVIEQTVFNGNVARGGAAFSGQLSPNPGRGFGGAVFGAGTLRLRQCTLEQNLARGGDGAPPGPGRGGALASHGSLSIDASTFNDNHAASGTSVASDTNGTAGAEGAGGAVYAEAGSFAATNSTFAFNRATGSGQFQDFPPGGSPRGDGRGGALALVSNSPVVVNVTLAFNFAETGASGDDGTGLALGGGIFSLGGTPTVRNSIIASNSPGNFSGMFTDSGYNLSSDSTFLFTGTGSRTNVDPLLGALTTNGGPTRTMSLLADSSARDLIPFSAVPPFDQRGVARTSGTTRGALGDSGAVEAEVVISPPTFVVLPSGGTARVGESFTFQALATGQGPLGYFWLKDGGLVAGASSSTLFLANVQPTNAGHYVAVVTNISGAVTSTIATLIVDARPFISSQPADQSVAPGGTAIFAVGAGPQDLRYAWFHDGLAILDATNATFIVPNASPASRGGYQVVITNFAGAVTSRLAVLTFNAQALSILDPQPQGTNVLEGRSVEFVVIVSGVPPWTYQWYLENLPIAGATNKELFIAAAQLTNAGVYRVVVTNAYASLTSASAILNVIPNSAGALLRGPYLQSGSPHGAVVRWRSENASDAVVRVGTNLASPDYSFAESAITNDHIVQLSGLEPDTLYYYSVGSALRQVAGGTNDGGTDYWFRTPPLAGTPRPTRVWVLGDSGTAGNGSAHRQIITRTAYETYAATNGPADLWLMLGDNAYNSGTDLEYQRAVFDIYPATLRNLFLWPALGNHETGQSMTATDFPYLNIFSLPRNAESGGLPSGTEKYYSFDHANIHFVCLDSMTSGRTTNTAMAQWLVNDLAATAQEWIIAYFHHPPYTKGSHDSDGELELIEMRQHILPILEAHGADLVLAGHSHCYERSFLLNGHYGSSSTLTPAMKIDGGDGREDGDGPYRKAAGIGTSYIVAGHSGQASGGSLDHPAHFLSLNELGSLVIDVVSNRLEVVMLGTNAAVRDRFTIMKQETAPFVIGAPPVLAIAVQPTGIAITCRGTPGRVHRLQSTAAFGPDAPWEDIASETPTESGVVTWSIPAATVGGRFYRVVSP